MTPQRHLCPNPQNLEMCYFTWQKGFLGILHLQKGLDMIKDLKMGDYFGWFGWALCYDNGPHSEGGRQESWSWRRRCDRGSRKQQCICWLWRWVWAMNLETRKVRKMILPQDLRLPWENAVDWVSGLYTTEINSSHLEVGQSKIKVLAVLVSGPCSVLTWQKDRVALWGLFYKGTDTIRL